MFNVLIFYWNFSNLNVLSTLINPKIGFFEDNCLDQNQIVLLTGIVSINVHKFYLCLKF